MKQKVFVQGRELKPRRVSNGYIPLKDTNSFSEINFSQINSGKIESRNGFHVRNIGKETPLISVAEWEKKCNG